MFREPSWNNPVVRFIKSDKTDIVNKISRDWSLNKLVGTMLISLKRQNNKIPAYLEYLYMDLSGKTGSVNLTKVKDTPYRFLPMSIAQANAVENALQNGEDPAGHLSPSQIELFKVIKANPGKSWPDVRGKAFTSSWQRVTKFLASKNF